MSAHEDYVGVPTPEGWKVVPRPEAPSYAGFPVRIDPTVGPGEIRIGSPHDPFPPIGYTPSIEDFDRAMAAATFPPELFEAMSTSALRQLHRIVGEELDRRGRDHEAD